MKTEKLRAGNQVRTVTVSPAPRPRYGQITVAPLTDLTVVARANATTVQWLRYLNPKLRYNITPPESYLIRVPAAAVKS